MCFRKQLIQHYQPASDASDSQITFHKLSTLTEDDVQAVQERIRLRVLKNFKRNGLLIKFRFF